MISTIWLGIIGFLDDYIKVYKKDKEGLAGRFKILGQVGIGVIVALFMVFNQDIVVKEQIDLNSYNVISVSDKVEKSAKTTIPFMKDNEFDYQILTQFLGETAARLLVDCLCVDCCICNYRSVEWIKSNRWYRWSSWYFSL